eukprot:374481-Pyramimonas_sp.AAC.1
MSPPGPGSCTAVGGPTRGRRRLKLGARNGAVVHSRVASPKTWPTRPLPEASGTVNSTNPLNLRYVTRLEFHRVVGADPSPSGTVACWAVRFPHISWYASHRSRNVLHTVASSTYPRNDV